MPILEVEIVVSASEHVDAGLAPALAEAAGEVLGTSPGRTWVRLRKLSLQDYAEQGGGPPAGTRPVFVTVLKARHPQHGELEAEVARLTQAIARVCGRPAENVHLIYAPHGAGRVAFGGTLVPEE